MRITELKLSNFRSFSKLSLEFDGPVSILLAPNTYGKTNILEALYYGATGRSFKADLEKEIIKEGENFSDINLKLVNEEGDFSLRIFLSKAESETATRKRLEVNGVSRRLFNFLGHFRAVLFSPEDLNLITDSPSKRRKHLDRTLSLISVEYYRSVSQYQKVIIQRNRLLQRIRDREIDKKQLFYWNEKLLRLGESIHGERKKVIELLNQEMKRVGKWISKDTEDLEIIYFPSILSAEKLEKYELREIESGQSLIGPHRDDYMFSWKGKDLAKFGSRGEQRLGILALKTAETYFIEKVTGERPVLFLDDIFSELDRNHQSLILPLFDLQQTIITTTETSHFPKDFLNRYQIINLPETPKKD